ncbi:MAG: Crp/Fnr family transcriptional regulator [Rhodospirillales bacterium]|nr:Crp/Fnr family transcriptional regulator [Rhodospirillales bacterium]
MSFAYETVFRALGGRERWLAAGQTLFRRDDPVASIHAVLAGEMRLVRHRDDGGVLVLQRARAGALLAEASLFAKRYHCDAIAGGPARVLAVGREAFRRRLAGDADLAAGFAATLAREVQAARLHAELLAMRTVAERLEGWLAWHDGALPAKGGWRDLAAEIGVTPEALYREIARRRTGA